MNFKILKDKKEVKSHMENIHQNFKNKELYNIAYNQIEFIESFNGMWFLCGEEIDKGNRVITGNYFLGLNEITGLNEGYISIFMFDKSINYMRILAVIQKEITYLAQKENVDWIYMEIFNCGQSKYYQDIINNFKIEFPDWKLATTIIQKNINNSCFVHNFSRNIALRYANKSDERNVLDCLIKAYLTGTPTEIIKMVSKEKIEKKITDYYTPLLKEERLLLICEKNGEFCGHACYDISNVNERQALLVDIFIIDKYKNNGFAKLLSKYGESECEKLGFKRVIGTVEPDSNNNHNILLKLGKSGWSVKSNVFGQTVFKGERNFE